MRSRYLLADSVSQKGNFTWAGQVWCCSSFILSFANGFCQTFGDIFSSDGRPVGTESITTISCSASPGIVPSTNICQIPLPAPGFALVFLTPSALSESEAGGTEATTFPTTAQTRTRNTVTVDQAVLATSNGHSGAGAGAGRRLGSTSSGSIGVNKGVGREDSSAGMVGVVMCVLGIIFGLLEVLVA